MAEEVTPKPGTSTFSASVNGGKGMEEVAAPEPRTSTFSTFVNSGKGRAEDVAPEPGTSTFSNSVNGGKTIDECEGMIRRSLRTPMAKFLLEHLEKSGCPVGDRFIEAVYCDKQIAGGYVRGEGIRVCSNHMTIQDEVNQVVIHELIHAYDDCRAANLDWANCAHHACSEIRAGHLSGDCHYKRELLRGFVKLRGHEQMIMNNSNGKWEDHKYLTDKECLRGGRRITPDPTSGGRCIIV
ncbi:Peptidase M76, ATP [Trema orientale]|uniref:Mitochondrial inner membrane protease ATP23 n=1 Tax=Trema orientale TaxID=63057 RepID=A0A2P5AT19_TREOI|nr:Peptidase M76, ATP [Trema orientale]